MTDPISTGGLFDSAARNVSSLRARLSELGREVSTKTHVDLATSDPAAARTASTLRHEASQAESEIQTAQTALRRSKAAEEALGQVKTIAQEAYETALAAPKAEGATQFGHAGDTARQVAHQVTGTLNTELAGTQLFAGTETATSPMAAIGDEAKPGSPLGMVKDRLESQISALSVSKIRTRGDALRLISKGTVTAKSVAGGSLSVGDGRLTVKDSGRTVGELHVDTDADGNGPNARDEVTVALAQDFDPAAVANEKLSFEINGKTVVTASLSGSPSVSSVVGEIESAISNAASGGSLDGIVGTGASATRTTAGGLDAEFHGDPGTAGYYDAVYQGATEEDAHLTARANDTDVAYSARADSTAVRNVMEGLLLEAVVDKPQRSGTLDSAITREGVNALRDIATARLKAGIDGLGREQGELGLAQRSLEDAKETLSTRKDAAEARINELENVDRAAAITKLQNVRADLQATYKTTARLQQLSLARYL